MMKMMMMMTKKPIILVICVLLVSSLAVLASDNTSEPSVCCFGFHPRVLPKKRVLSYKYTDDRCSMKAVLLTMKKGGVFCVDPSQPWVKNITEPKEWVSTKTEESSGFKESA